MKQDFKLVQDNHGLFDIEVDPETKDFKFVEGFETAIDVQLFTDRRSNKNDVSIPRKRKGWICDLITKQSGYELGSFLYLKFQSRNTIADKNEIAAYAKDALNYFTAIGAAKEVTAVINGDNVEGNIQIDSNQIKRYSRLWRNTQTQEVS